MSFKEWVAHQSNSGWDDLYKPKSVGSGVYNDLLQTVHIQPKLVSGRIVSISYNSNPIKIALTDGTTWVLSKGQFDHLTRLGKKPEKGKVISLQILPDGTVKNTDITN